MKKYSLFVGIRGGYCLSSTNPVDCPSGGDSAC